MKHLGSINPTTYFCKCGLGPADNCPAFHVTEFKRAGSPARHYAALVIAIVVFAVMWALGR